MNQTNLTSRLRAVVLSIFMAGVLIATAAPVNGAIHCHVDDRGDAGAAIGATVDVRNNRFRDDATGNPFTFISAGEAVQWTVTQGCHTISEGVYSFGPQSGFDSGFLSTRDQVTGETGESTFTVEFSQPGIYSYYCKPHVNQNMRGIVVVSA